MSIFEDMKINVKAVTDVISEKAEHLVNISKYKLNLVEIDKNINKCLLELGKCAYNAKKSGDELAVDTVIAQLDELYSQRDVIAGEIAFWDASSVFCPVCGQSCVKDVEYCPACGAKLEHDE